MATADDVAQVEVRVLPIIERNHDRVVGDRSVEPLPGDPLGWLPGGVPPYGTTTICSKVICASRSWGSAAHDTVPVIFSADETTDVGSDSATGSATTTGPRTAPSPVESTGSKSTSTKPPRTSTTSSPGRATPGGHGPAIAEHCPKARVPPSAGSGRWIERRPTRRNEDVAVGAGQACPIGLDEAELVETRRPHCAGLGRSPGQQRADVPTCSITATQRPSYRSTRTD
jgi:hypothetical protein